jgi:hypothetical protein
MFESLEEMATALSGIEIQMQQTATHVANMDDHLAAVEQGQADMKHVAGLIRDCHEVIRQLGEIQEEQGKTFLTHLQNVFTAMVYQQRRGHWWQVPAEWLWGMLLVVLLSSGVLAWRYWKDTRYTTLAHQMDTVLVHQWKTLPKAMQDTVSAIYGLQHVEAPGKRQAQEGK